MEAVTDCEVLEASTPHLDDVVRLSDRYGRANPRNQVMAGRGRTGRRQHEGHHSARGQGHASPAAHALTPKPMLRVAGQPVMEYILDDLRKLGGVEEVIYITGHLKEKVEAHCEERVSRRAGVVHRAAGAGRHRGRGRAWRGRTWISRC